MSQLSVLIVEDEAILAAHLASKVKLLGYRVTGPVPTGEEALALAQAERPDIALLDIRLAGHMTRRSFAKPEAHLLTSP